MLFNSVLAQMCLSESTLAPSMIVIHIAIKVATHTLQVRVIPEYKMLFKTTLKLRLHIVDGVAFLDNIYTFEGY